MILYAKYSNVEGLSQSNPVVINGLKVGSVTDITNDADMKSILVSIELNQPLHIPDNSVALIIPNPLGNTKIEIKLGDSHTYLQHKDSITTQASKGIVDDVLKKVDPLLFEVKTAVKSLDSLIGNVNNLFDNHTRSNISSTIDHVNQLTYSLMEASKSIESLMNKKTGSIVKSIDHLESITGNLSKNNKKINDILQNLDVTTQQLSNVNLASTLQMLDSIVYSLHESISKKEGSVGLLLNDPTLYKNLSATSNKLNTLLDDVRLHPKRYISVSVFGKKEKVKPIASPLPDTLNAPYINKP